ncbi:MAG: FHA domain-containing protein, partial [Xanthomonadales bacterium]|nr:FHA domain-containing protein [Xanthomonadales bacterium]
LSPSVVLVLKLVAADRVQPVTGIVVSGEGLVLVPADFVSVTAELVVLDGGTDILGNGRPATVFKQLPDTGLALLSVAGLKRPAVALSAGTGENNKLYLHAFPPAGQIAEGAEPLQQAMEPETPLPYVTGAIMDACGLLSGVALTSGKQSLETTRQPVIIDSQALATAFEEFQLNVPRAACRVVHEPVAEKADAAPVAVPESQSGNIAVENPAVDMAGENQSVETESQASQGADEEPPRVEPEPLNVRLPERAQASRVIPWWLKVVGLIVLVLLARGIFVNYRKHARKGTSNPVAGNVQPASDEPDTVRLSVAPETTLAVPRSGRDGNSELPGDLPAGCNGLVVLEGEVENGRSSRYFCAVDINHFDLVIGRGEADIRIENAAISRRHARLECRDGVMTITDLGSSNGLHVNRVPCLPGELMYVEPGSQICLGDVCLSLELVSREASS